MAIMAPVRLSVRAYISFTVWEFSDSQSWVPGTFSGDGYADIYDVNLQPKPSYSELQQDLRLAVHGAPPPRDAEFRPFR